LPYNPDNSVCSIFRPDKNQEAKIKVDILANVWHSGQALKKAKKKT